MLRSGDKVKKLAFVNNMAIQQDFYFKRHFHEKESKY